jgi:hypothetical protein
MDKFRSLREVQKSDAQSAPPPLAPNFRNLQPANGRAVSFYTANPGSNTDATSSGGGSGESHGLLIAAVVLGAIAILAFVVYGAIRHHRRKKLAGTADLGYALFTDAEHSRVELSSNSEMAL